MSDAINNGGPAFPSSRALATGPGTMTAGHSGMTLRDYFAAKALAALIGHEGKEGHKRGAAGVPMLARYAYEYADAMLAARGEA